MDLALNNLQRLIYHKRQQTKPNQNSRISRQVFGFHWSKMLSAADTISPYELYRS